MNKFTEKNIIGAIKNMDVKPSKTWQKETSHMLRIYAAKNDVLSKDVTHTFSLFNNFYNMKKILSFAIVIALVVIAGKFYYSPENKATRHLNNANAALEQLNLHTQDESFAMINRVDLLSAAYADEETENDKSIVEELVETVLEETESAIEECELIRDTKKTAKMLKEVDKTQDKTMDILSDVLERTENENLVGIITKTIDETVAENKEVEDALDKAEEIEESEIEIEIVTSKDPAGQERARERHQEKNEEKLEQAKQLMNELNENAELIQSMQQKKETIQALIQECEESEKCQAGKAKGLATALNAKVQNEVRSMQKTEQKEQVQAEKKGDEEMGERVQEQVKTQAQTGEHMGENTGEQIQNREQSGNNEGEGTGEQVQEQAKTQAQIYKNETE